MDDATAPDERAPRRDRAWRGWADVADLFAGPDDTQRDRDRPGIDDPRDPWVMSES